MAMFPMEPPMAKALILAHEHDCSVEVIKILAMLQTENIVLSPSADAKKDFSESARQVRSLALSLSPV